MSHDLAKTYRPHEVEPQILQRWIDTAAFHAEPDSSGEPYCIVIPPPNVTAPLHIGHALNNTLQDILIRCKRMQGNNVMWMPGTDHAGIATQTVVEKRVLEEEGKKRTDFERDVFVAKIQAWKDQYEGQITKQLRAMGCSCDWDRQRFTMDLICTRAVREAFFRLFKDGLIYRGKRLVNWDPATQTALADDEVEMEEVNGHFYYMNYPLVDGSGQLTIATTRPETMLGDTAVAVNPRDPRAPELRGKKVRLPIVNRVIPIIEDEYVILPDPDGGDEKARFSSGFLKVTPAHDPNDWEIGLRFNLDVVNVMAPDGSISNQHGWSDIGEAAFLLGMDRFNARDAIVNWFEQQGLMAQIKPYRHVVGHSYRSHVPIEPYLSDQWYVKVTDERLAGTALQAIAQDQRSPSQGCTWKEGDSFGGSDRAPGDGELSFFPARYTKMYQSWHENIRDWCISRQLWWGHRIPVWSHPAGKTCSIDPMDGRAASQSINGITYVCVRHEDDGDLIEELEGQGFTRDEDVLDTWFSSALWPISTMGWPDDTAELRTWNPSSVLCTGRDIITLWVSRMVMFNRQFRHGLLPFRHVYINPMIQDGHGQRMSKSLGNGVDPLDIIHSHGADALRLGLCQMATSTQDVRLPVDMVCSHCGHAFHPKQITSPAGHRVADPRQQCPDCQRSIVSGYGVASGKVVASDRIPQARNTSEKFDAGRNFANKLWNAVRFALSRLSDPLPETVEDVDHSKTLTLPDRWILSRLTETLKATNEALRDYEFSLYAQGLRDFIWGDFCDWYIEAVKATISANTTQRQVLAAVLDVTLRLLHPVMPFLTEALWARLNDVAPDRGLEGVNIPPSELLVKAPWPDLAQTLANAEAESDFSFVQQVVGALREVRTTYKIPPRQMIICSSQASEEPASKMQAHQLQIESLVNATLGPIGPTVQRPADAAATLIGELELYVHGLIDADAELTRLNRRLEEVNKSIKTLQGRLSNKAYVEKAPAHLVEQTRQQLAAAAKEAGVLQQQAEAL